MNSMAFCILTANHADLIEEFLRDCSSAYVEMDIDIYVYDSSGDSSTEEVLRGWPEQEHIFYVRCPEHIDADKKIYWLYQGSGLKKPYEFLWMSNDSLRCGIEGLRVIRENLNSRYDMIFINPNDAQKNGIRDYTDCAECLRDCAFAATRWGHVIINTHTTASDVDWDYYMDTFHRPDRISWSHIGFYFTRAAELNSFRALHLPSPVNGVVIVRDSENKTESTWSRSPAFWDKIVMLDNVFSALPEAYTEENRQEACRRVVGSILMPSLYMMCLLRRRKLYNFRVLFRYWNIWGRLVRYSRIKLFLIAMIPTCLLQSATDRLKRRSIRAIRSLSDRCGRLFIYGAGINGKIYAKFLENHGIPFAGFCVTYRRAGKDTFCGRPVYGFSELETQLNHVGFVIALSRSNTRDVLRMLERKVDKSRIFCNLRLRPVIGEEFGYWNFFF